ncbi:hypothetical protein L211DRAFT_796656 [Terfezia boudieri ATCC MYA-4762]|uniref:Inactive metallocarboxypeptidase ECM14 n=1 Tax=Terfezia boudieri ATCC MYA-4762 TaxID=1051890 RepID=A0A3N4L7D7_9PEZI|nr:hypothetical protein L211DRAFT_796656 [Terfezia boudieri ATCC MYA-4762]
MRTDYLVLGVAVLSSVANAATIPLGPPSHSKSGVVPELPDLVENPSSWKDRLRGLSERLLGKTRHGLRDHEQKHLGLASSQMSKYTGDIVLRFNLTTQAEGKALVEASQVLLLDVWSSTKEHVDLRLAERDVPSLLGLLPNTLQHAHARLMPDLGRAVQETFPGARKPFSDQTLEEISKEKVDGSNIFFQDYQPLSVIVPWMKLLESLFPAYVQTFSIGASHEGREIMGLRVGTKMPDGARKKAIIVTGAAHAREWISVSTVSYLAYSFIINHLKDKRITALVDGFDWIFIPTLNVDGYAYTWEHDRLWRKNRQPTSLSFCKGIDLDRAYDIHWEAQKTQSNPCSDSFPGEKPFEAVEAKILSDWVAQMKEENLDFIGYLDFHSYSQQILYPYSYSCSTLPPDLENLEELAMGLAKVIRLHSGEHYEVASACGGSGYFTQTQTGGGGSALDYLYTHHVPFAYQIKLRDTGSYGFLLPRENILPTGEESLGLLKYFGEFLSQGVARSEGMIAEPEAEILTELRK